MADLDPTVLINLGGTIALDILGYIKRKQAEAGRLPTDAEVLARVRSKIHDILAEGTAALAEFPMVDESPAEPPDTPSR